MIEGPYVEEWLYGVIARDPGIQSSIVQGRVYRGTIAQDTDDAQGRLLPAIRFFQTGSVDLVATGAHRVQNTLFYQIEVIDEAASISHLRAVADRFDYLLHGSMGRVSGLYVMSCTRNSELNYMSIDESLQYQHLGGVYRIQAQAWNGLIQRFGAYASGA
jgi:hypothetical protein